MSEDPETAGLHPSRLRATVSAHVLILEQPAGSRGGSRLLLARLAYRDHRAGKLSFPGGFVDQGEGLETALKREVFEEIGLELGQCRYQETVPLLLVEPPNVGFIFTCDRWSGTPGAVSREILETLWVDEKQFWQLDREGLLAYPHMRDQTRYIGWRPPGSMESNTESGQCIWSRSLGMLAGLALAGMVAVTPVWAGDAPAPAGDPSSQENLEKAREHLLDAMRALGKAGSQTYDEQMPTLKEKAGEAFEETQRMLKEMQKRLPEQLEKLKPEMPESGGDGKSDVDKGKESEKPATGTTQI
ncbi:MAG: NUDIX hydrolase [Magnetococcales bacterium]|nr:NUDIX hydrolase [Magnetococcales bacterium]